MANRLVTVALLAASLAASIISGPGRDRDPLAGIDPVPGVKFKRAVAAQPARRRTPDPPTTNYHHMRGIKHSRSGARSAAAVLGAHQRRAGQDEVAYQNVTTANAYGVQYAVSVGVGNHTTELIVDTGSADTWVIREGFRCVDYSGLAVDAAACGFGPPHPGGYQYGPVPGVRLFVRYGDGETTVGDMGRSDVALAGLTVRRQQLSLANESFWYGDNATSGILGLAFEAVTNAYLGDGGGPGSFYSAVPYPPVFTSMWQQGLVRPVFSLALMRNSTAGVLGWGGVPSAVTGVEYSSVGVADLIVVSPSRGCLAGRAKKGGRRGRDGD